MSRIELSEENPRLLYRWNGRLCALLAPAGLVVQLAVLSQVVSPPVMSRHVIPLLIVQYGLAVFIGILLAVHARARRLAVAATWFVVGALAIPVGLILFSFAMRGIVFH